MLSGQKEVLEIGCGDGWGAQMVLPEVQSIRCIDIDPALIQECRSLNRSDRVGFEVHDMLQSALTPQRDAAYLLDVLEHVKKSQEDKFFRHVAASIKADGVCIVGIPSIESQRYASKPSRATHVNCKSGYELKAVLDRYFKNVFLFSMNDEMVHTGFSPMAHYLFGLCAGVRDLQFAARRRSHPKS